MDKTLTWLTKGAVLIVIGGCLLAYLNLEKKPSLIFSQPTIEDLKYKELDNKRANAEFAAKRDSLDYDKFGSTIFCNSSMNSWIESVNYSKQMDLYILGKTRIYQNGIMQSKIMKTKGQDVETLILKGIFICL